MIPLHKTWKDFVKNVELTKFSKSEWKISINRTVYQDKIILIISKNDLIINNLSHLCISNVTLSYETFSNLCKIINKSNILTTLELNNCKISNNSIMMLSHSLMENNILKNLIIKSCYSHNSYAFSDYQTGTIELFKCFGYNKSITNVDIDYLMNKSLHVTIAETLRINNTLKYLKINTDIDDECVSDIVESLKVNKSLLSFEFTSKISNYCAKLIADMLLVNNTITDLGLHSFIEDDGIAAISNALKINSSVKKLDLRWNKFGSGGRLNIIDMLKVNETIERLGFANRWNEYDDVCYQDFFNMLENNYVLQYCDIFNDRRASAFYYRNYSLQYNSRFVSQKPVH